MTGQHILVIDDEPDIRNLVREILEDEDYEVSIAENADEAREQRRHRRPDLILLDIWMPGTDGITLLKEWKEEEGLPCPVIMMSGHGTVETAVEATRLGAYDFIEKPISLAKLLLTINRALEAEKLAQENIGLKRQLPAPQEPIGNSAAIADLKEQIRRTAQHDTSVLITGEQGCGKQTFGRYLHQLSPRHDRPFVELAVIANSGDTAARELFGTEQGEKLHYGLLEQANGGTLFIEELTDLDLDIQAHLLTALESSSFLRIGGSEPVEIDVRVIAASHKNLEKEVAAGRVRDDLYYRLNVVPLAIPPLHKRPEDIPELLQYYVEQYNSRQGLPYRHFPVSVQNYLRNYPWPGNVRELQNLVQRLLILGHGAEVELSEVEAALSGGTGEPTGELTVDSTEVWMDLPLREAREAFERHYLQQKLREVDGNMSRLAQLVGMERTHLYRKLRALEIDPKQRDEE
jgi:DNA-binding NtrC family response regulator